MKYPYRLGLLWPWQPWPFSSSVGPVTSPKYLIQGYYWPWLEQQVLLSWTLLFLSLPINRIHLIFYLLFSGRLAFFQFFLFHGRKVHFYLSDQSVTHGCGHLLFRWEGKPFVCPWQWASIRYQPKLIFSMQDAVSGRSLLLHLWVPG